MIESNRIYNMDCVEGMRELPDKSIDCVICDLPYGTTACSWDSVIPFDKLWEQYERICKDTAAIVLFGSEPFSSDLRLSNRKLYKYDWYWNKSKQGNFAQAPYMPLKNIETISVFSKGNIAPNSAVKMIYNPQGTIPCNKINNGGNKANAFRPNRSEKDADHIQTMTNYPRQLLTFDSSYQFIHPTQKPEDLIRYLVRTYSNPGDTILDNCMGSGTTAVAAVLEKRKFIGFETDATYFEKANERLRKLTGPFRIYGNIGV